MSDTHYYPNAVHPDVFHPDERRAQALAQFDLTSAPIRPAMPEQHREFFAGLPYVLASTLDENGWPVATLLSGPRGFIRSPDATHLRINAPRREDDPALAAMHMGKEIGLLGIDFSNRRRNRANGRIGRMDKNRIEIDVDQSFGNCAKYIQTRELVDHAPPSPLPVREDLTTLDDDARRLISGADTFFVATHAMVIPPRAVRMSRIVAVSQDLCELKETGYGYRILQVINL